MTKIEDRSDLRILADALCNLLRQRDEEHHNCYLGIEGDNGVACEKCQRLAIELVEEQARVREGLKKLPPKKDPYAGYDVGQGLR
jgi:hypothetical protein